MVECRGTRAADVKGRLEAQEVAIGIVVIARDFHLDLELCPRFAVETKVDRYDMVVVTEAQVEGLGKPGWCPRPALAAIAVHDEAPLVKAKTGIKPLGIKEEQASLRPRFQGDLGLYLIS